MLAIHDLDLCVLSWLRGSRPIGPQAGYAADGMRSHSSASGRTIAIAELGNLQIGTMAVSCRPLATLGDSYAYDGTSQDDGIRGK